MSSMEIKAETVGLRNVLKKVEVLRHFFGSGLDPRSKDARCKMGPHASVSGFQITSEFTEEMV